MALPWLQSPEPFAPENEEQELKIFDGPGQLVPPAFGSTIDFGTLDTRRIQYETRNKVKETPAVVSAKENSEAQQEFNKFCEEKIEIQFKDMTKAPRGYGIPKELEEAIKDPRIVTNFRNIRVVELNPLQTKAIQIIREGKSLIVMAPTGIGKTYAFLLPAVEKAMEVRRELGSHRDEKPSPSVLILSSTGRLATQTFTRCSLILGLQSDDHSHPITDIKLERLVADHRFPSEQCDIAFATMGKLRATITSGEISLHNLKMVVLDEADKMIDESSFGRDVEWVMEQLPPEITEKLQCLFFSATFLEFEGKLTMTKLQIDMIGDKDFAVLHCPRMKGYITQNLIKIPDSTREFRTNEWIRKMSKIRELIDEDLRATGCTKRGPFKETIIIFCERVQRVAQVTMALRQLGYNFRPMSRTITKNMQELYLSDLANCTIQGLVCTNIFARGIDIASVKHTIVMEMSTEFSTYKHRIGRVGRDGTGGRATVFIDKTNLLDGRAAQIVEELLEFMNENDQQIPEWCLEWYTDRQEQYREVERNFI